MLEDMVQWVERVDQLTYDMEEFLTNASVFGVIIGFAVLVIFVMTIFNYASMRRIEQKLNYLMGEVADLYDDRFMNEKEE